MTLRWADRVADTSTTTGTGNITVSGSAPSGYITFSAIPSITTNDTFYYGIADQSGSAWETGLATWLGSNIFARTTVLASSNSGSIVNFTSGSLNCWLDLPASVIASLSVNSPTLLDSVSGSFNSSTTTFNLTIAGVAYTPANANALLVVLGGVVQQPGSAFTVSGSTIVFTVAPVVGDSCFIVAAVATNAANVLFNNTADQLIQGGANVTSLSLPTGNVTIDCGARPLQYITNNGAFTITAPANDGSCYLDIVNGASASTVTWSGFTVGSSPGDALTTTNGNKFRVSISRINGVSTYIIKALQ